MSASMGMPYLKPKEVTEMLISSFFSRLGAKRLSTSSRSFLVDRAVVLMMYAARARTGSMARRSSSTASVRVISPVISGWARRVSL